MRKKILSILLASIAILTPTLQGILISPSYALASESQGEYSSIRNSVNKTAEALKERESLSEWQVPSMVRTGKITEAQKNNSIASIKERITAKYEDEYSSQMIKDVIVLTSLNENPQTFNNYDLINEVLKKTDYVGSCNYEAWLLSVIDNKNYNISEENKKALAEVKNDILKCQDVSGGFSYSPDHSYTDVDMTGMALYALSPYYDKNDKDSEITKAIESGKDYILSSLNSAGGKFDNSNTTAMAILGLSSIGQDTSNLVNDLISYQSEDGLYKWKKEDEKPNDLSTEQSLYALIQYNATKNNKDLFNFTDKWKYEELNFDETKHPATDSVPDATITTTTDTATDVIETPATSTEVNSSNTPTGDKSNLVALSSLLTLFGLITLKTKKAAK